MRIRTLVGAAFLFAALAPQARGQLDNEACLACHAMEGLADAAGRSLVIDAGAFGGALHGFLECTSCHTDVTSAPHEEPPKHVEAEGCSTCHSETVDDYRESIHGEAQANENGNSEAATCSSCHGSPHYARKATDPRSPVYPLNLPRTCGTCHGDRELARRHNIPVEDAYQLYMDSIHGRALTHSGLLVSANCSSCHGAHRIRPKKDPRSRVARDNVPATCGTCHAGVEQSYRLGVHSRAVNDGNPKAPVCVDCHSAHRIARVEADPWKLRIVSECGTCHDQSLKTYRDTLHGQVTALGFTVVARCSDCHGSHAVLPGSDPASSIAPANLVATCQKCHPQANANFVLFSPHADAHDAERYPVLYYTTILMHVLIIGTFAFFGLHTVLWLVRSLFERNGRRRQTESEPDTEERPL